MPRILLAPSYGNPKSKKRYDRTILGNINFCDAELAEKLTAEQKAGLRKHHSQGVANFWGSRSNPQRDRMMDGLGTGDIVLFTGAKKIKAAGEVGYRFRNQEFADALWRFPGDAESFVHIYSVVNVRPMDLPHDDLLRLAGYAPNFDIPGQIFVKQDHVKKIIRAFDLSTSVSEALQEEETLASLVSRRRARVTNVEKFGNKEVVRTTQGKTTVTQLVEAGLVEEYMAFRSPQVLKAFRIDGSALRADLYWDGGHEVEIVEAKSLALHSKVREAVAQLLDYAVHSPKAVTRLTALFPRKPDPDGLSYLHRMGIDCEFLTESGAFVREPAPDDRREYMLPVWRGESHG